MNGGHQTLNNAELLVDNAGQRSQAVGGAARVGNDLHVLGVGVGVDAHYEHGSGLVLRGSGDNNLLRAADEVLGSALFVGEHASGLGDVLSAGLSPRNLGRILASVYAYRIAVNDQLAVLSLDGAVERAMYGIILHHVNHVIGIDEGIVYSDDLNVGVCASSAHNQPADAAETINTNLYHWDLLLMQQHIVSVIRGI